MSEISSEKSKRTQRWLKMLHACKVDRLIEDAEPDHDPFLAALIGLVAMYFCLVILSEVVISAHLADDIIVQYQKHVAEKAIVKKESPVRENISEEEEPTKRSNVAVNKEN